MFYSVPPYVEEELGFNKKVWTLREFKQCCQKYKIKVFTFKRVGGQLELSPYNFPPNNLGKIKLPEHLFSDTPFHGAYGPLADSSGAKHQVIILDGDLGGTKFLIAGLHELGHFFHSPDPADFHMIRFTNGFLCNLSSTAEYRAHIFPVCALLPKAILESKTVMEIQKEFGYLRKWINFRLRVAKKFGL